MNDRRLIEDYLPIQAISKEASREKSVRKGHISTLHLWWARRPLVACRAAVYGALVSASKFIPENGPDNKKQSLGRANAAKFVEKLCQYPGFPQTIKEAQGHILEAHAERLTGELRKGSETGETPAWVAEFGFSGDTVTVSDIEEGRAPRPRVLDMFAGGGSIPLEALRLGCEAYALDLNPVAHIIQLCTLVYPQKYGKPDQNAKGMIGTKNEKGETTWGGLAEEVRYWGEWVLEKVRAEVGDLYPLIPDPEFKGTAEYNKEMFSGSEAMGEVPPGYLMPVAYLWTRTVKCKNPACGAIVPLVKQTWLCKKKGRFAALRILSLKDERSIGFEVVESTTEKGLGFDPSVGSKGGNATCLFCGTVADSNFVKSEGLNKKIGQQMMAIACTRPGKKGKIYLSVETLGNEFVPDLEVIPDRTIALQDMAKIQHLTERIEINPRSMDIDKSGFTHWSDIFTGRQQYTLMSICSAVKLSEHAMKNAGIHEGLIIAILTMLASNLGKFADFCSTLCTFNYTGGRGVIHSFPQQSLPMVWDFAETNPFNPAGASWLSVSEGGPAVIEMLRYISDRATVNRGSAFKLPYDDRSFDAIITDPPYYDNVSYSNLSDFFYIWLKRSIGSIFPEHFATEATPKKSEAIAAAYRHGGNKAAAKNKYEEMMEQSFREAYRVLKPNAPMAVVYAHKTTLGWSTLVEALRRSGFAVSEAWPLDTERKGRVIAMDTAALASSIFLVARKREANPIGQYDEEVRPELKKVVSERVESLWKAGITGADLVIACVGAGLRAFTRYARVEYANGEPVPAERFLAEIETVVLDNILRRLSKEVGSNGHTISLDGLDSPTRFYVLWRYTYRFAPLDAGEAIIFANGTHVELDGQQGLSTGANALLEKKKGSYLLRDFKERGNSNKLGLPEDGAEPPVIDSLHRVLWLMENKPTALPEFLSEANPRKETMRLVAQVLAGPVLKGGEMEGYSPPEELSALAKLTANWKSVVEDATFTTAEKKERDRGQRSLFE